VRRLKIEEFQSFTVMEAMENIEKHLQVKSLTVQFWQFWWHIISVQNCCQLSAVAGWYTVDEHLHEVTKHLLMPTTDQSRLDALKNKWLPLRSRYSWNWRSSL